MELPVFFAKGLGEKDSYFVLDANASRHCIVVLRRKAGDPVLLADGKGKKFSATITDDHWKKCTVSITAVEHIPEKLPRLNIAISFTKNSSRMEWFMEKATEIGIQGIFPLQSARTEKDRFRAERFENILSAAMLQSRQFYLPALHEPASFEKLVQTNTPGQKFIAHCADGKKDFFLQRIQAHKDALILIGPEGDFTAEEIALALKNDFHPVSLGDNRLRTETAGVVACALLRAANAK
ncbi:MAG TPA: RsmE family RNA methyltransferase [Chitinophagaceae bacterium]